MRRTNSMRWLLMVLFFCVCFALLHYVEPSVWDDCRRACLSSGGTVAALSASDCQCTYPALPSIDNGRQP